MKKSIIAATVLAVSFAAPAAFAADTDTGTLTINGLIKGTTCHFEPGSQTAHIDMHQIGTSSFKGFIPGQAYEGYSNKTNTPFKVICDSNAGIPRINVLADQFDVTGDKSVTKNNGGDAKGVGYALLINGQRVNTNDAIPIAASQNAEGKYTFDISALYARANDAAVTAGTVNSTITLTVVAD